MNFSDAKDESLLAFYASVRRQVDADNQSGGRYRFVGESTKQYASKLREEMDRRRLRFIPIDWPR
jgi:site-specific DNA-adenine methylase